MLNNEQRPTQSVCYHRFMSRIANVEAKNYTASMRAPFRTALGKKSVSKNLKVYVTLESGARGAAEASSSLALPGETPRRMKKWLRSVHPRIVQWRAEDFDARPGHWPSRIFWRSGHPTALGALETAILIARSRERGRPLVRFFGTRRADLPTDVTISIGSARNMTQTAVRYFRSGIKRFKIKIGRPDFQADLACLAAIAKALPDSEWWLDGNQGLNWDTANKLFAAIKANRWPVRALEQPTPKKSLRLLKRITNRRIVPVYADESAGSLSDVKRILRSNAADGVVVKVAKTGLSQAMEIVRWARRQKKAVMLSCMAESAEGLAPSVLWAIGDGRFDWIDLDSCLLTKSTIPRNSYRLRDGRLGLPRVRKKRG